MKVIELTKSNYKDYHSFLHQSEAGLFYYSLKYKAFLETLLNADSKYLIATKDTQINGILPLMMKNGPLGTVINSLPFYGSNGGIISNCEDAQKALEKSYTNLLSENEYAASTIIQNPLKNNNKPLPYDHIDMRIGQWTILDKQTPESLMSLFDSSTRRNIRKSIKSEISVIIDNSQLSFLNKTHKDNMAAIGGLSKSDKFFELIPIHFEAGKDYNIYIALKNNQPIAALLLFYFNDTVEYFTPAIVNEFRSDQALAGIIFQAMSDAIEKGYKRWNWGGTWATQEGVYKFKKKWAAQDIEYQYFTKVNTPKIIHTSKEYLLEHYPNFFVVPFNVLKASESSKTTTQ